MKKRSMFFIIFLVSVFTNFSSFSQSTSTTTISYRINSPRILYNINNTYGSDCENLEFDIEVKADATTRYFALQVNMSNNNAALTDLDWISGYLVTGSTWSGYYTPAFDMTGGNLNLTITSTELSTSSTQSNFAQITTSWQVLGTFKLRITDNTAVESASFLTGGSYMDGKQYEKTFSPDGSQQYLGYTLANSFSNLYLGRIYSSTFGWSQVGGVTPGSQYTDWTTAVNTSVWDTTAAPAQITGTNSQTNNLRIHSGAALKIIPGGEIQVAGTTEINEPRGLWIASDNTGTGAWMTNGTVTYNGSAYARIDRFESTGTAPGSWHLIGFPLHDVNPQLSTTFLSTYLEWYDETLSTTYPFPVPNPKWQYVISETSLTGDLKGWSSWASTDYTIKYAANTANPIVSGTLSRGLTITPFSNGGNDGWNLVANMYPCPIDWESLDWNKTNVDNTIYLWSQSLGNYATYNGNTHGGTDGGTRYIPSMQGYFVHVTSVADASLYQTYNVKVFNSQAFWKDQTAYDELLDLNVEGNGYKDEAKVWFNHSATVNFDPVYDNYKLIGSDGAPQFYSQLADGNMAAVNTLPWGGLNTVVPMGFSLKADAPVTMTASNRESFKPGTRIFLEDIKETIMHELTANPVYTFTASPNDDPNRFVLHFYNPSNGIEGKNLTGMQIYSFEDYVYVRNLVKGTTKGTIQMYDLVGRKVFSGNLKDMELNKYLPGVNEGYYMVRVVTDDNSYTQKVYLKKR